MSVERTAFYIQCFFSVDGNTWIGGRNRNGTGFQWYDNKGYHRDMIYADWALGQPSLPDQNCVQMSKKQNYKWDNEFCHQERQFICKRTT
jgi:hypothetical protein